MSSRSPIFKTLEGTHEFKSGELIIRIPLADPEITELPHFPDCLPHVFAVIYSYDIMTCEVPSFIARPPPEPVIYDRELSAKNTNAVFKKLGLE